MRKNEKRNGKALLPIVVFVVLYLGLGILFEYGLDIEMGFYKIPVVVNDKRVSVGSIMFDMDNTTRVFIFEDNDSSRYLHVYSKFYSINNGVKFLVNIPFLDFAIQRYESL